MSAKRGPYNSPRQLERQQRILECAREAIDHSGYDALTMNDLAATSGVSVKTLYNLFGSKDELLLLAVADLLTDLSESPQVSQAAPGIARMLANLEVTAAQIVATPAYAETMARALFQADREHRLVEILLGNTRAGVLEQLQLAQGQGELREEVDLEAAATLIAGQQWSAVLLWVKGLLALDDYLNQARRGLRMALIPLCAPDVAARLQDELW